MLRRHLPLTNDHLYLIDSETESEDLSEYFIIRHRKRNHKGVYIGKQRYKNKRSKKKNINYEENCKNMKALEENSEMMMIRKAEKYQLRMKRISIPATSRATSPISSMNWQELAKSIKQKYDQPLHYLTNKLLKEWDESRIFGSDISININSNININVNIKPILEDLIDSAKAESTIWVVEHLHRQFSSPQNLAKLWLSDPFYQDFLDPIIP